MFRAVNRGALALVACAGLANASVVTTFTLSDHPDGNANPPGYGLRFDGLFTGRAGATGGTTTFSIDAGHARLRVIDDTGTGGGLTIRIWGTVYGGEDTGSGYGYGEGFYDIDMTYVMNVAASGTGWIVTGADAGNAGSIVSQGNGDVGAGEAFHFTDKGDGSGRTFLFLQDEHRLGGYPQAGQGYWVGRGWHMSSDGLNHLTRDWLFLGTLVPTPGALGLLGLAGLAAARRRR
ncbi:MAG: hypothetical protein IT439_00290 [Phycisphaerales bacterium]|nr:hypothetical protein [Phycisphaerales bacterium]